MARLPVIVVLCLLFPSAYAQQNTANTAPPAAQSCVACHGAQGQGTGSYPHLAGLGEAYFKRQLDAFASGERVNAIMKPIASGLSEEQRQALAGYFSALAMQPGGGQAGEAPTGPGRELALHGRWQQDLPACVQCHGPGGLGIGTDFPPIAGQPAGYLRNQLKAWRSGDRPAGPQGLMGHIAEQLDADDLKAVAEYFASLPAAKEANNE